MMKTQNPNQNPNNVRQNPDVSKSGGKRPENKDDLDSRKNEEQEYKGDDVTHNEKETKEDHLKKK